MFAFMVWSVVLFFSVIKVLTFPQTIYIYNASETRVFGLRQVHVKVHRKISSHILFFFFQVHMF
jgi:hypothetical protein